MKNPRLTRLCCARRSSYDPAPSVCAPRDVAIRRDEINDLEGTVTDFQFINPHVEISFVVKDDKGKIEQWIGEANSPNVLSRHGWSRDIVKPGDQITLIGNRGKNGSNTLRLQKIVSNGQELDPNSITD